MQVRPQERLDEVVALACRCPNLRCQFNECRRQCVEEVGQLGSELVKPPYAPVVILIPGCPPFSLTDEFEGSQVQ